MPRLVKPWKGGTSRLIFKNDYSNYEDGQWHTLILRAEDGRVVEADIDGMYFNGGFAQTLAGQNLMYPRTPMQIQFMNTFLEGCDSSPEERTYQLEVDWVWHGADNWYPAWLIEHWVDGYRNECLARICDFQRLSTVLDPDYAVIPPEGAHVPFQIILENPTNAAVSGRIFCRVETPHTLVHRVFPVVALILAPNPCNGRSVLTVRLPRAEDLRITVANILGQEVLTLADGFHDAGEHRIALDASNLASGRYLIHAHGETRDWQLSFVLLK